MHNAARKSVLLSVFGPVLLAACVQEIDTGPMVILPEESVRYERFIQADSDLMADRITIQAVTAYRKDVATIVNEQFHTKQITPTRITLTSRVDPLRGQPVSLSFRNMRVRAREKIEVVFSDVPLLGDSPDGPILLVVADGLASLRGGGVDAIADRLVIRNDQVKAFGADGNERPISGRR